MGAGGNKHVCFSCEASVDFSRLSSVTCDTLPQQIAIQKVSKYQHALGCMRDIYMCRALAQERATTLRLCK
jgi:hypothetical protein